jgi:hypothetical protein
VFLLINLTDTATNFVVPTKSIPEGKSKKGKVDKPLIVHILSNCIQEVTPWLKRSG